MSLGVVIFCVVEFVLVIGYFLALRWEDRRRERRFMMLPTEPAEPLDILEHIGGMPAPATAYLPDPTVLAEED